MYIYILTSTDRLFRYITTLHYALDTNVAWSWDWNPPNLMFESVSYRSANKRTTSISGVIRRYVVAFVSLYFCITGYQSAQFIRRALHYSRGSCKFLRQSAQPPCACCHSQNPLRILFLKWLFLCHWSIDFNSISICLWFFFLFVILI